MYRLIRRLVAGCLFVLSAGAGLAALAAPSLLLPYSGPQPGKAAAKAFRSEGFPVRFDIDSLRGLRHGEVAEFRMPSGRTQAIVFDLLQEHGDGIASWIGYARDHPGKLRTVITTGPAGTFGRIATPDGDFGLAPGEGHDWLVDMLAEQEFLPLIDLRGDTRPMPARPKSFAATPALPAFTTVVPGVNVVASFGKAAPTPQVTVDLLILYTNGLATKLGAGLTTRFNQLVASANTAYADSEVAITLRLVGTQMVNYSDATDPNQALIDITPAPPGVLLPVFSGIETLRTSVGADLVALLRNGADFGGNGIAWVPNGATDPGDAPYMYSVTTGCVIGCDNVFIHELGHNMGNQHDRATVAWESGGPQVPGSYSYSFGYYSCQGGRFALSCNAFGGTCPTNPECSTPTTGTNNFKDLMAYFFNTAVLNYKFSNPAVTCVGALNIPTPCGSPVGQLDEANAALSMNNNRVGLSGLRAPPGPPVPTVALVSNYNPVDSGIGIVFTATVTGSAGTPTGTINFRDGASSIAGCSTVALAGGVATCSTAALSVATHQITAVYSGSGTYAGATSAILSQAVTNAPGPNTNVALASASAVASATSTLSGLTVAYVNNGNRSGSGGFWADGTPNVFPDTVTIVFPGPKTINRVVVYSVQDAFGSPVEPTDATTFSLYGITAFTVEAWNGSSWVNVGTVTGNTLVKRTVNFAGTTTSRIRVNMNASATDGYSRLTEIEAFTPGPAPLAPTVTLVASPNPSTGGQTVTFTATVSGSAGTPTGTVSLLELGLTPVPGCTSVALVAGIATCTTSALPVGTHPIGAAYAGDLAYASGASNTVLQVVNPGPPAATNVALASNGGVASATSTLSGLGVAAVNNNNRTGAGGNFWADATPGSFPDTVTIVFGGVQTIDRVVVYSVQDAFTSPIEPTDTTTFSLYGLTGFTVEGWNGSGWVNLGTVVGNNLVKRTVSFAPFATDRVRVNVTGAGDPYSRIVEIEAFAFMPGATASTVTLGSAPNPSTGGQSVTFTAIVSGAAGTPTGTVNFREGAATIAGCNAVALVAGNATCTTSALSVATHSINAAYSGSTTYAGSTSNFVSQVVNAPARAAPTVTLVSSPNPSASGQTVTFTTTVSGSAGTPTGTVSLLELGLTPVPGCTSVALVAGIATCTTSAFPVGTHPIGAAYVGDVAYTSGASNTVSQVVNAGAPVGTNVALAANGGVASATSTLSGLSIAAVNNGERTGAGGNFWADSTPGVNPDTVTIVFNGLKTIDRVIVYSVQDAFMSPITPTDTTTFSLYGLTGFTVEGWNGGSWVNLGTVTGNNLVKRTVSFSPVTIDRIRVNVNAAGDPYSRVVEIEAITFVTGSTPSTTTLGSSLNPSTSSQAVTFTATVSGGAGTPTGTVNFLDGASTIPGCAAIALAAGSAACTTSSLSVATHSVTAAYAGNATYAASTSVAVSQVVNPGAGVATNVALASSGAVATANSTLSGLSVAAVNNNERTGAGGNFWADSTPGANPDTVTIVFSGVQTIDRVVVYSVQDAFMSPIEPGDATAFSLYGLTSFTVEGWTGSSWVNLGTVTGNNLVKRTVSFAAFTTDRIRVNVNVAGDPYSRIAEIEAFTPGGAPPPTSNVALASAGAVASASSTLSGLTVASVNNNNRTGAGAAFWADSTPGAFPDTVQVVFNGMKTLNSVVVYSVQDAFTSPVEPTDVQTFSLYGLTAFTVEGWNGSAWVNLGTVAGNNLVKRTVSFAPFTTDRVRVNVLGAGDPYSRIVEIEAWGN